MDLDQAIVNYLCLPPGYYPWLGTSRRSCGITVRFNKGVAHSSPRSNALFSDVGLIFEKTEERRTARVVRENQEIYEVKPARKKLK